MFFKRKAVIRRETITDLLKNGEFSLNFLKQLSPGTENLIFSPVGIHYCLSLLYSGSSGKIRQELEAVMQMTPETFIQLLDILKRIDSSAKRSDNEFNLNSLLAAMIPGGLSDDILDQIKLDPDLEVLEAGKSELENTSERIKEFISTVSQDRFHYEPPVHKLREQGGLILLNSLKFFGKWQTPFDKKYTTLRPFTAGSGAVTKVPMMNIEKFFGYYEEKNIQILQMPYKGLKLSMIIVLPSKKVGLSQLVNNLHHARLNDWLNRLENRQVDTYIPKFLMTINIDLVDPLKALGINEIFNPDTKDLSGLSKQQMPAYVERAWQQSFLEVEESGTRVVSVTGLELPAFLPMKKPKKPVRFMADHPFLFFIMERDSGLILFMGRLDNPATET